MNAKKTTVGRYVIRREEEAELPKVQYSRPYNEMQVLGFDFPGLSLVRVGLFELDAVKSGNTYQLEGYSPTSKVLVAYNNITENRRWVGISGTLVIDEYDFENQLIKLHFEGQFEGGGLVESAEGRADLTGFEDFSTLSTEKQALFEEQRQRK